MAQQNRKTYYWHIWSAITHQDLLFKKDRGQLHERPLILLSESEDRIEKSCFYQECKSYRSMKIVYKFPIFAQKMLTSVQLYETEN